MLQGAVKHLVRVISFGGRVTCFAQSHRMFRAAGEDYSTLVQLWNVLLRCTLGPRIARSGALAQRPAPCAALRAGHTEGDYTHPRHPRA